MLAHYPNVEKSQLVSYVEDYLECVESLPLEVQRNVSLLLEIDTKYQEVLSEVDDVYERYKGETDAGQRKRLQNQLQRALISSQELGDEKIHIVTQMLELVENRSRQMESHTHCFSDATEERSQVEKLRHEGASSVGGGGSGSGAGGGGGGGGGAGGGGGGAGSTSSGSLPERSARRPRRQRNSESRDSCHGANGTLEDTSEEVSTPPREKKSKSAKKKKRAKAKQEREASPVEFPIDPNEPTYCLCEQVSYGEMIGCDNEQCPIEWFHFTCVGLTYKPKGKWYCPKCRGDNEKTMDKSTDKPKKDRRSR
ncbi:hypothetical protein ACEWY4_006670 [Coilia grayii]|uniref:Inhibitor of growth protein n=1 Tax=Coilia grayii TaxID=363190 RepID=A0ABD1KEF1_9TELE